MNSLEQFDSEILPLGLYASDELVEGKNLKPRYQEWKGALVPFLKSQGYPASGFYPLNSYASKATCEIPEIGQVSIVLVKFSNIKVRKYGSGYYVDKREDRAQRWERVDLSRHISQLWKQHNDFSEYFKIRAQILLFAGFDKSQRPLESELRELHTSLKWENKGVSYSTRTWQDKAKRGFGVRLAVWSRPIGA